MTTGQQRALIHLDEPYTHQAVVEALKKSALDWDVIETIPVEDQDLDAPLQWLEYELINWSYLASRPDSAMANAYCIRKGLIRKAQFGYNVAKYLSKNPTSILKEAIPETWLFELDHVDYFEEAMNEVFEVERDLLANENDESNHMFIIKPSLANKAAGIRVFNSLEQLRTMFEENELSDSEDDDDMEDLSQVREWVIQRYIHNPLLVHGRKFHVRAYVLAVSNIKVYLYHDMLALFAMKKYNLDELSDTLVHLTNTCIQTEEEEFDEETSVRLFWDLEQHGVSKARLDTMFEKMQHVLADVFDACASEMTTFQAMPNAFELFGVDFLLDENDGVYFLEANAFPDFKQTGKQLQHVIQELFEATTTVAIEPFFTGRPQASEKLVQVYHKELLSL
ncbi:tubulin-tyrosine ligase family-domain-containing protein [Radiomyces spectabilis]|uniref:tubulin-tyrosine ligase family-domain-containing protein n=1 Tax=Radiomyces spectabilis TaxID=64574 RepID=UPI00221F1923|nr:tubulin-tyrosine ligase family-domain-containing protein [Radiomyces spectabilis]KAI8385037.1 tubulin-tyrosine ligase family-domain-containing protein [Radiomyces spectabilis]